MRAGLWAPCACNLQTLRVIVITEEADKTLFKGEVRNAPAYIVICQDRRPYDIYGAGVPAHNRMLTSAQPCKTCSCLPMPWGWAPSG